MRAHIEGFIHCVVAASVLNFVCHVYTRYTVGAQTLRAHQRRVEIIRNTAFHKLAQLKSKVSSLDVKIKPPRETKSITRQQAT